MVPDHFSLLLFAPNMSMPLTDWVNCTFCLVVKLILDHGQFSLVADFVCYVFYEISMNKAEI